ncbi:hypothetical protein FXV77_13120 [Sphingobacterium phlebotomi]|uniref:Uncharacterized protein n=1 Tax=Sphingobacterium phlebotomi TaxID=2605433 RepID=A0A5D4H4W1_9SPHI|nr:hypothetical protein [Sphingobacterium phlebotomi]TYR35332.1 hypothetical protein FXV77_13120 [Sphingobacterium phlebotomi]
MIDKLQQIIQQVTTQEIDNNNDIANNLAGNVAKETGSSLIDGLKSAVSGGNLSDLTNMLSHTDTNALTSNPVVKNIISSLASKLGVNVGLDSSTASSFASAIIPQIISMIASKVKSGDFNISDIMNSFNGGGAGAVLDQNGDGKIGIDDAISAVTKGKLGDTLGGLFKK